MFKFFTAILLPTLFCISSVKSQNINYENCSVNSWQWATSISSENSNGNAVLATDKLENLFVAGSFSERISLQDSVYTSRGGNDSYLIKNTASGLILWTKVFAGMGENKITSISPDQNGNLYVSGYFVDSLIVEEQLIVSNNSSSDIFLAKFNLNGELEWLKKYGGAGYDNPGEIKVDVQNQIYVTGSFSGIVNIENNLVNSDTGGNSFLLKLNESGNMLWLNQFGDSSPLGLKTDVKSDGHVIVGGSFIDTLKIEETELNHSSGNATFLAEFSPQGNLIWVHKTTDGQASSLIATIKVGTDDAIYIGGNFMNSYSQDELTIGDSVYVGSGGYIAKFDANGNPTWSRKISDGVLNYISDLTTDVSGDLYATGLISNTMRFGQTQFDGNGGIVAKFGPEGEELKLWSIGSFTYEYANYITSDISGNIYCTGLFEGSESFGANSVTVDGGYNDAFVARLNASSAYTAIEPDAISSNIAINAIGSTQAQVVWENGDGVGRAVVMKKLGKANENNLMDGIIYDAGDGVFGAGSSTGGRQYVVYSGEGNEAVVTGLEPNSVYSVAVFEYNLDETCQFSINYKTDNYNIAYLRMPAEAGHKNSNLNVFPNPVDQEMNITLTSESMGDRNFQLVDQNGKGLYSFNAKIKEPVTEISIDLSPYNLSSGIYYLKVNDNTLDNNIFRVIKK